LLREEVKRLAAWQKVAIAEKSRMLLAWSEYKTRMLKIKEDYCTLAQHIKTGTMKDSDSLVQVLTLMGDMVTSDSTFDENLKQILLTE
jgi:hypothetical protein